MKYKKGDILKGKINGAIIEIIDIVNNEYYVYKDAKTRKKFISHYKTMDRCLLDKVN